jgi:hypothetical protein
MVVSFLVVVFFFQYNALAVRHAAVPLHTADTSVAVHGRKQDVIMKDTTRVPAH